MPRSSPGRLVRRLLLLLVVVVLALVAYTGYQALTVKSNLERAAGDFATLSHQLTSGDASGARATLGSAQRHARAARDGSSGPGWWLTRRIPGVGPNVAAVRSVARVADDLASRVLPDVVDATATMGPEQLRPVHGRIDLAPIRAAAPMVVRADQRLAAEDARVQAIRLGPLAPQIASPVRLMQKRLDEASTLSGRLSRAVRLLPPMLGAEGPRTYLLMLQSNAEARSTGGVPGAFATVRADRGKVSFGRQADAPLSGRFDRPVLPLTSEETALFGTGLGHDARDVNRTPDFPRSAQLLRAMWRARTGEDVDGVLSVDPVALAHVLRGTGPVQVPGGRLTADDAVRTLLSSVYARLPDPRDQRAYVQVVARTVFDAVSSGQGHPVTVLSQLATSVQDGRVLLWSAHRAGQALIEPTDLSGALATQGGSAPRVGVFLNDGGASRLDFYLGYDVEVTSRACSAQRQLLTVTLHLRSRVPKSAADLPDQVLNHTRGLNPGVIRLTVLGYAPVGGRFDGSTLDGKTTPLSPRQHAGRQVVAQTVDIRPGAVHTLTWQVVGGRGQLGRAQLRVTPGAHSSGLGSVTGSAC